MNYTAQITENTQSGWLRSATDWLGEHPLAAQVLAIAVMALAPWLETSSVRSGRYRPMFKWWFWLLVIDFFVLMWLGAMPAEEPYATFSLIASAYWFAYFLIILPLLGVIEKPLEQPETIEADFEAHMSKTGGTKTVVSPTPAE